MCEAALPELFCASPPANFLMEQLPPQSIIKAPEESDSITALLKNIETTIKEGTAEKTNITSEGWHRLIAQIMPKRGPKNPLLNLPQPYPYERTPEILEQLKIEILHLFQEMYGVSKIQHYVNAENEYRAITNFWTQTPQPESEKFISYLLKQAKKRSQKTEQGMIPYLLKYYKKKPAKMNILCSILENCCEKDSKEALMPSLYTDIVRWQQRAVKILLWLTDGEENQLWKTWNQCFFIKTSDIWTKNNLTFFLIGNRKNRELLLKEWNGCFLTKDISQKFKAGIRGHTAVIRALNPIMEVKMPSPELDAFSQCDILVIHPLSGKEIKVQVKTKSYNGSICNIFKDTRTDIVNVEITLEYEPYDIAQAIKQGFKEKIFI
ncbi:MAG: hypothetical protein HY602_00720 [Parcubacteria group bacterium]|nr:hypothetical protein [Parcubacteria group bacterium]